MLGISYGISIFSREDIAVFVLKSYLKVKGLASVIVAVYMLFYAEKSVIYLAFVNTAVLSLPETILPVLFSAVSV